MNRLTLALVVDENNLTARDCEPVTSRSSASAWSAQRGIQRAGRTRRIPNCSTDWQRNWCARNEREEFSRAARHFGDVSAVVEVTPELVERDPDNRLLARGRVFGQRRDGA
jgi:hypothetical protein